MNLEILKWVQSFHHPVLDQWFLGITLLGEETFVLVLFAFLYWILDKELAKRVVYVYFLSLMINHGLKSLFAVPRPVGLEGIRSLRTHTATGYAFPSGHTQGVSALFFSLSASVKSRGLTVVAVVLVALVALSRVYLGLHWPTDVLGGAVAGLGVVWLGLGSFKKARGILAVLFSLVLAGYLVQGEAHLLQLAGILAGYLLGELFERKRVDFSNHRVPWLNVLRLLTGLIGMVVLKEGLKVFYLESHFLDSLRYGIVTFYAMGLMPWIIKRLNI
ncbi:MAG: hypothetical protein AVO33_06500 [delta proteobacterium ML8_F1]|nr:MAG: hypothetical protein AVO33_06500 [delta proteobacterium ML8_F1]